MDYGKCYLWKMESGLYNTLGIILLNIYNTLYNNINLGFLMYTIYSTLRNDVIYHRKPSRV